MGESLLHLQSLFFLFFAGLGAGEIPAEGPWVVRLNFADPVEFRQITRGLDHFHTDLAAREVVVIAGPEQLATWFREGVAAVIDWEQSTELHRPPPSVRGQVTGMPGFPCYPTLDETFALIDQWVQTYPNLAAKIDIGDSWLASDQPEQGDDLLVLRLTNQQIGGAKPALFVMTAMHAREYPTAPLTTDFARQLLEGYGTDADATWILDYHEIHLLLQANPDGRRQAESLQPFWRKNHNTDECLSTVWKGTDLNRNFPFQWNCCPTGSSGNPCDQTYRGLSPASEPETLAVVQYVQSIFPDQRGPALTDPAPDDTTGLFIDIHNFGGQVLWPFGFDCIETPNGAQLQRMARKFAFFNGYSPENAALNFNTNGTTDDFAYGDLGIAAFTVELGEISDFSPTCAFYEQNIRPGNLAMLRYAAKASRSPYLTPAGPDVTALSLSAPQVMQGTPVTLTAQFNDDRYRYGIHVIDPDAGFGNCPPLAIATQPEAVHAVAEAIYTIGMPPWAAAPEQRLPMLAEDTLFNQTLEDTFALLNTAELEAGQHTIYVQARDADGHWGEVSAIFLTVSLDVATLYDRWPEDFSVRDFVIINDGGTFQGQ